MTTTADDDSLAPLARRIQGGDIDAFETVFRTLHAPLCEVVDAYVRSQAVAEDIVQDLFLAFWIDRSRVHAVTSLRAYLFTAARNRALHHLRHRAVVRRWSERERREPSGVTSETQRSPDRVVEADEARRGVRAAIDRLSPRTRLAFVLQWEFEMSHSEIATAMGISNKGVEKLLTTAKTNLRRLLADTAGPWSNEIPALNRIGR